MFVTFTYTDFDGQMRAGDCEICCDALDPTLIYALGRLGCGKRARNVGDALKALLGGRTLRSYSCYDYRPDGSLSTGPKTHEVMA